MGILITLIILSVLVLIHEAGHFFAAKKFNIKVEEFGFGLPPRAWGKKIGETIYSLNWLPIGGFVKLYGEDEAGAGRVAAKKQELPTKDVDRAFFSRPVWQRATVVVAGVVMNALLAFIIYYVFLAMSNYKAIVPVYPPDTTNYPKFALVNQTVRPAGVYIEDVFKGSPAEEIGIVAPVKVLSINNTEVKNVDAFIKAINANKGKEITLRWLDVQTMQTVSKKVTPRQNPPKNEGALGISINPVPIPIILLSYDTQVQKIFSGISHPINLMRYNLVIMGELIRSAVQEREYSGLSEGVSGPVGIFAIGSKIGQFENVKIRIMEYLNLAGILSISLAFFNVLPIPALDGGRLFFILIEGIFRRKVSERFETAAHTIGMAVLITLILLVTFKDLIQLFT